MNNLQTKQNYDSKLNYYLQKKYTNTSDFFKNINELHIKGGIYSVIAGDLFEQFNMIKLPELVSNVKTIWDTNDINNIPNKVIQEIFGNLSHKQIEAIFQKGSSYALDKIMEFTDNTYGFVSDKSTKHGTLNGGQASDILKLTNLKLNKISGFWICSNAEDLPRRVGTIFQGPAEYQVNYVLADDYIGDKYDNLQRARDRQFWKEYQKITQTKLSQKLIKVNYTPYALDGQHQINWTNDNINYAKAHIKQFGRVYHWAEGSMGLGKSILDPWQSAEIQLACFDSKLTNTEAPVSVVAYDKRTNAKQNGNRWIAIQSQLIKKPLYAIWVTQAKDPIDNKSNVPQYQSMNINLIVSKIREMLAKGFQIQIITLHCHGQLIKDIETDLYAHIPGFKFWEVNFDEYDLLATQMGSEWEVWWKIDSVRRYGSTGTPYTHGKIALWKQGRKYKTGHFMRDPKNFKVYRCTKNHESTSFKKQKANWVHVDHNMMCNTKKYGNRSAVFTFREAMDAQLIPPLQDIVYQVRLSEIKNTLLKGIKKVKGVPILKTKVTNLQSFTEGSGKNKKTYMLDVQDLARFWGVIKCLAENPHLFFSKRLIGFSHFLSQAKLFKMNWKYIVKQIEGNTKHGKILRDMIMELMQEGTKDEKSNERKRDNAWSHPESIIIAQKIFGRGTDFQWDTGFHLVLKSFRETMQEICRLTRLKRDDAGNVSPPWADQLRYYIFIVIKNDLDPRYPRYDEELLERLREIFDTHTSAREELEMQWRQPSTPTTPTPGKPRPFVGININKDELNEMIQVMSKNSPTGFIMAPAVEVLHNEILDAMMKLPNPTWEKSKRPILDSFLNHPIFLKFNKRIGKTSSIHFLRDIWRGVTSICKKNPQIRYNIQLWNDHLRKFQNTRSSNLASCLPIIRKYFGKNPLRTPAKLPSKEIYNDLEPHLKQNGFVLGSPNRQKWDHIQIYLGEMIRGTNINLTDEDAERQKNWWDMENKAMHKHNQKIVDEATKLYTFGDTHLSELMDKFPEQKKGGLQKLISTGYWGKQGDKFQHIDRTKLEAKKQAEKIKAQQMVDFVWDAYSKNYDKNCHVNLDDNDRDYGFKQQLIEQIKNQFGTVMHPKIIKEITHGVIYDKVEQSDREDVWINLCDVSKVKNWYKNYKKKHNKIIKEMSNYYHKHGSGATQKKYKNYGVKDDWLRKKFGKLADDVRKIVKTNKNRNALGRFAKVDK